MPSLAPFLSPQEYVDHGAVQFKCYVIGDQFFHAARGSTPDAAPLTAAHTLTASPTGGAPAAATVTPTAAASTTAQTATTGGQPLASISFHRWLHHVAHASIYHDRAVHSSMDLQPFLAACSRFLQHTAVHSLSSLISPSLPPLRPPLSYPQPQVTAEVLSRSDSTFKLLITITPIVLIVTACQASWSIVSICIPGSIDNWSAGQRECGASGACTEGEAGTHTVWI